MDIKDEIRRLKTLLDEAKDKITKAETLVSELEAALTGKPDPISGFVEE